MVMKLKISNCDETQKTQIVRKLKNSNCDENKIQNVTKLKNLSFDKT